MNPLNFGLNLKCHIIFFCYAKIKNNRGLHIRILNVIIIVGNIKENLFFIDLLYTYTGTIQYLCMQRM